jgi:hypothetical protein
MPLVLMVNLEQLGYAQGAIIVTDSSDVSCRPRQGVSLKWLIYIHVCSQCSLTFESITRRPGRMTGAVSPTLHAHAQVHFGACGILGSSVVRWAL